MRWRLHEAGAPLHRRMAENASSSARNVALLIDADNASPDALDPVLAVLAELGTVNIRRAYGNWQ